MEDCPPATQPHRQFPPVFHVMVVSINGGKNYFQPLLCWVWTQRLQRFSVVGEQCQQILQENILNCSLCWRNEEGTVHQYHSGEKDREAQLTCVTPPFWEFLVFLLTLCSISQMGLGTVISKFDKVCQSFSNSVFSVGMVKTHTHIIKGFLALWIEISPFWLNVSFQKWQTWPG